MSSAARAHRRFASFSAASSWDLALSPCITLAWRPCGGHAEPSYDRIYVALSIIIAIGASTAALGLAFRTTDLGQKFVAAVVMGLAISGMHYTAMWGTISTAHLPLHEAQGNASLDQTTLALAVAGITFVILAVA